MTTAMYTWPSWMDVAVVDDYGIQVVDRRIKTEMEIGAAYRVEFPDADECTATCSLFCDELQAAFFESFEKSLLKQGSIWFKMPLWVAGELQDHTVRFSDRIQLTSKNGPYTTYTFTLDVEKREGLMDEDLAKWLLTNNPCMDTWPAAYLHFILHVRAPKVTTTPPNIWTATPQDWEDAK